MIDATEFTNAHTSGTHGYNNEAIRLVERLTTVAQKQVRRAVTVDGDGRQIVENPCRADDDRASRSRR